MSIDDMAPNHQAFHPDHDAPLGPQSRVPLVAAWGMIVALLAGALWISRSMSEIDKAQGERVLVIRDEVRDLRYEVGAMRAELKDGMTRAAMMHWVLRLKMANPNLNIPEEVGR